MRLPISRYVISGHSMTPTLKPGQLVLVFNWAYLFSQPKVGQVIIFKYDGKDMVKRVVSISETGVEVLGDNSEDSLPVGKIPFKNIIGKVLI